MKKAFFTSSMVALLVGLLFHLIGPAVLGGVMASLLTGLSVLDPLGANQQVGELWLGYGGFLALQGMQMVISGLLTAAAITWLAGRVRSGWLYLAAIAGATVLQLALLLVYVLALVAVFPEGEGVGFMGGMALFFTLLAAPITGLACAWAARKWGG